MVRTTILRDAICAEVKIHDADERARPFYREFNTLEWTEIRDIIGRLVEWKIWNSPASAEIDQIRLDSDRQVKDWLRAKGLTTGYLLGAPE